MESVELKTTKKDWIYILIIGALFGFFISFFFYFLDSKLQDKSTIIFGTITAVTIALFSSLFITISNNYILPKVDHRFWYFISFCFSFSSGAIGFYLTYSIASLFDLYITNLIEPYSLYLTFSIGFLTFLIGLILHQFISMKYKNELTKTEILDSKIKALENELNPHFLFNALNSMSELVYIDQKKAESSILNLSKFLRNAIKTDSLIYLSDEISMVKTYVEIENIRFNNQISLEIINLDESEFKVPKFSIQLLIENGIKHGYEGKPLHFTIVIENDSITITNNGKKIEKLVFGTGLSNLKNRLKLLNIGRLYYIEESPFTSFQIKLGQK
jgi:two-component system LytT family sensor kinase